MSKRPPSPFRKRALQLLGRPVYVRLPAHHSAAWISSGADGTAAGSNGAAPGASRRHRSMLGIAYTGVRRPCICTGCICLTPAERQRQQRVFALVRAVMRARPVQAR